MITPSGNLALRCCAACSKCVLDTVPASLLIEWVTRRTRSEIAGGEGEDCYVAGNFVDTTDFDLDDESWGPPSGHTSDDLVLGGYYEEYEVISTNYKLVVSHPAPGFALTVVIPVIKQSWGYEESTCPYDYGNLIIGPASVDYFTLTFAADDTEQTADLINAADPGGTRSYATEWRIGSVVLYTGGIPGLDADNNEHVLVWQAGNTFDDYELFYFTPPHIPNYPCATLFPPPPPPVDCYDEFFVSVACDDPTRVFCYDAEFNSVPCF